MGRTVRAADPGGEGGAVKFLPTRLTGACVIELERFEDERGFFARSFCRDEFAAHGLKAAFVQCNVSFNATRGTLRGLHYQASPHEEAKLVRCTRGAIFDVIVDLRKGSGTYLQWISVELTAENHRMLYVPEGFAHGFQTLEDGSEVFYHMSEMFRPEAARGARWNDPAFGITWPLPRPTMSARDAGYANFVP
jgi:dTDP-4-dehydrorhamnose 3,5-epimerase